MGNKLGNVMVYIAGYTLKRQEMFKYYYGVLCAEVKRFGERVEIGPAAKDLRGRTG